MGADEISVGHAQDQRTSWADQSLAIQMEDVRLGSILAVRTILTPEQFSKFVGLMRNLKRERNEGPSERGE